MADELWEVEKELFTSIRNGENIALVSGQFEDKDAAIICTLWKNADGAEVAMYPIALLLTDELKSRLTGPFGEKVEA